MRMQGRRAGEDRDDDESKRERRRHMLTVPPRASPILAALPHSDAEADVSPSSSSNSASFFSKDGRKISVGDCALFKPSQDSLPFIGIIRSLTSGKENKLRLSVNWLYRPAEVKIGKSFLLEAAPNEIFYSFHKDEIPAASLLHPCKVAFLPKGVELPTGFGSFVCRKVYDTTKQCLWWLTDRNYINERQEEVNQLLYKTHIEMHAAVPLGGRSPKSTNGPTSTSQLKPGSDSLQNSATFPSQVKGKKRERGDHVSEPVKRECYSKMEDGDAAHCRTESSLKYEIAKITEKGGLVDYEGVEKLVQLMLPERNEKKIDLVCRSMLAGVVAVTDKFDCLDWFVQLRGLPVFDEWLQEVHKGKIGDGSSPKAGDKSVEEFLLILLRALDKLPVNLHALQMCNIGKSVNNLRTHKNLEIQKKARSLVDMWKKRVEAEMDAKSGSNQAVSWHARSRLPEVPHNGNRQIGGSSEVAIKSLVTQPAASKGASVKLVQGETAMKSAFASSVSMKSASLAASVTTNLKDGLPQNAGGGASDIPSTPGKDEKSSSSSQSHNNSQSCSSDHAKAGGFSGKEDARSSTAVSMTMSKTSGSSSRSRKSANGFPGTTPTGVQRETRSSRSSSWQRNPVSEKLERVAQSSVTSEKAFDVPVGEGSNHKLIVNITNRGQNVIGGSFEDPSVTNSRASSPMLSDKQDQSDRNTKEKSDANISSNVKTESWQINDIKDAVAGTDKGDVSPAVFPDEKGCRTGDNARTVVEISKDVFVSSGDEIKAVKFHEASLSSINALIESCAKYSEASAFVPVGDDIGMNLLASVAAGEMSKSDIVSPTGSPQGNTSSHEHLCDDNDSRVKSFPRAEFSHVQSHSTDGADDDNEKQNIEHKLWAKNADSKQDKPSMDLTGHLDHSPMDLQRTVVPFPESSVNSKEKITGKETTDGTVKGIEEKTSSRVDADSIQDAKQNISGSLLNEDRVSESDVKVENGTIAGSSPNHSSDIDGDNKKKMNEGLSHVMQTDQTPSPMIVQSEFVEGSGEEVLFSSGPSKDMASENVDMKSEKVSEANVSSCVNPCKKQKVEGRSNAPMTHEDRVGPLVPVVTNQKDENMEENLEASDVKVQQCTGPTPDALPALQVQETGHNVRPGGGKLTGPEGNEVEESSKTTADASFSAAGSSDMEAKVEFDLNEGFSGDDGKYGESNNLTSPGSSTVVQQLISPLPFPVSSVSSSLPASITVAAAAKGPFVPPEDLLRSKVALGWKGSAATSAFRPAEPRKVLEIQLGAINSPLSDATPGYQNRPPLDIDLNVPDERIFEDLASRSPAQYTVSISDSTNNHDVSCGELGPTPVRCSDGLDLDLNRVEEHTDIGYSTSNGHRTDVPLKPVTSSSGGFFNGGLSVRRDFDLNDGPVFNEMSAEPLLFNQHARSVPSHQHVSSLRMNNVETGNFSSWFPTGNTYSTITVPSVWSDRGEHPFPIVASGGPQRILAPPTGCSPFGSDVYMGSVLSSSPAMPFPSTPFQYPVFPFGTSFLPSATFSGGSTAYMDSSSGGRVCFPAVNSQLIGPASALPSHYPRPCVVSLPDGSSSASPESSWKWGRQGLDLNAGPGVLDIEGRDETLPLVPRQMSVAGSQALASHEIFSSRLGIG